MVDKKGEALGEGIIMIYRIVLVSLIALVVLGISSVFYSHYINIRDAEAIVMARNVAECISKEDFELNKIVNEEEKILTACGYDDSEIERFYVKVSLDGEKNDYVFSQGDSGATWVLEIFENPEATENIKQYRPGYYNFSFPVYLDDESLKAKVEVLVNDDR